MLRFVWCNQHKLRSFCNQRLRSGWSELLQDTCTKTSKIMCLEPEGWRSFGSLLFRSVCNFLKIRTYSGQCLRWAVLLAQVDSNLFVQFASICWEGDLVFLAMMKTRYERLQVGSAINFQSMWFTVCSDRGPCVPIPLFKLCLWLNLPIVISFFW